MLIRYRSLCIDYCVVDYCVVDYCVVDHCVVDHCVVRSLVDHYEDRKITQKGSKNYTNQCVIYRSRQFGDICLYTNVWYTNPKGYKDWKMKINKQRKNGKKKNEKTCMNLIVH